MIEQKLIITNPGTILDHINCLLNKPAHTLVFYNVYLVHSRARLQSTYSTCGTEDKC